MCYSPDVDAEIVDEDSSFFEYVPKRYLYFEVISLIFSIVAVLFLVAFDLAEPSDTVRKLYTYILLLLFAYLSFLFRLYFVPTSHSTACMCYTNDLAFGLVCFFGPVIVCLMILAFYNVRTIRRVLFLFDYSGDDSLREIYKRLDPKSKNMFCRICIIPFCYLISLTPLIMYHMLLLFGLRRADDTVAAVVSSFLSISGICNFVLWVLFDEHARNSWWEWLSGGGVSCEEDRDSESILFAVVERGSYLRGKGHSVQGGLMTVKNNGIRLSRQSRPSLALRDLSSVSAAVVTNPLR